ncbi:anti-sigma-I factor RsgI family protein [Paenibacillus naphthalenovorans]|uniref:anti-sigma factor domain-containing protein n=1 Tax=Paenibacillus naphthalenovorans TaxID=162209 RepID=UPI003D2B65C1
MNKGIVMEITEKSVIVMRPDGRFQRLARKKRKCEIGEEITYADEGINWRNLSVAGRSAIVAAVVFCLVLFASFHGKLGSEEVVAYISIDINPSVEMGIDIRERVVELHGLNEDGEELIQQVDYKKKPLETVTAGILNRAESMAFSKGEADIVIASTVIQPDSKISDILIAEKLRLQVKEYIQTSHPTQVDSYQIASFAAPQEVREVASQNGVSMGKYTVYLNAKSSGAAITLDELKTRSVLSIFKESPEMAQMMAPDRLPTKAAIKQLMEEEKSGELDKRLQERLINREKADTNKGSTISLPDNTAPANEQKSSTVPSGSGKNDNNKDDKDSGNSRTVNARPGSPHSSVVTIPGVVRQADKKDDRDDRDDRRRGNNRDDDDDRNSRSIWDNRNSAEKRLREEAAKRLEEQKKREEEARKKLEELREKAEELKKKQAEEYRKRLEEERKKAEEQRSKDEEKRKEQGNRDENQRKKKDDDDSDSKKEPASGGRSLQNADREPEKVWNGSFTFPIFNPHP